MSPRWRAPGAGGVVVRATPGAPESATSARPPSAPTCSSRRAGGGEVVDDGGAQPAAEAGGERQLVAGLDLELVGQRAGIARGRRVRAQELVGRRELGPDARGVAARGLGGALGRAARGAGDVAGLVGLGQRRAALLDGRGELGDARGRGVALRGQRGELALERLGALRVELLELGLERLDALAAGLVGRVLGGLRAQAVELAPAALDALGDRLGRLARALQAQLDALGRRARGEHAPRERLALLGAPRQRVLGLLAAACDLGQRGLRLLARGARRGGGALGGGQLLAPGAHGVARELPARLDGLALEALVQLGRLGLALERAQARARLALDVEGAIEVVLRALELELGAAPALAVLAQPGGLLDEQPPVARLGGHDRLDAALRDDRVRLLAQAGVGEHLEDVDEAAARAVEAVLALAAAVQAAQDRDLAHRQVDGAVGVVEHELDLGRRARLHALAAAEDDVLHRLPADGQRRLLAHRPQHRVGHVGLARAVGARRRPTPPRRSRASCGPGTT